MDNGDPPGRDLALFEFPQPLSSYVKAVCLHGFRFPGPNALRRAPRVLEHVESLELHACDFVAGSASLLHVLDTMPQLKELVVSRAGVQSFSDEGIALCARWIPSHPALHCVTISVGPGRGSRTNEFNAPAIELLLRNCRGALHLTCHELRSSDFDNLCRGVENARLTSLTLRLCRLRVGENVDLARFLEIVGSNETLEELSLQLSSRGTRGDGVAAALANMLRTNQTLRRLKLTNVISNLLTEVYDGVTAGLAENRSIQDVAVVLRNAAAVVPAACLPDLVRALQTNVTIRELDGLSLLDAEEHPLAVDAAFLLKLNRFGRSLLWMDPPPPNGVWSRVVANISEAGAYDVMYRFLRTKLDLVGPRRAIFEERGE